MRILVDVDGVLFDFVGACCDRLDRSFNDIADRLVYERLDEVFPAWSALDRTVSRHDFHDSLTWLPGARKMIEDLREQGHQLIALTAPWVSSPTWCYDRIKKLEPAGFSPQEIIFCPQGQKKFVDGDILIEDTISTAIDWRDKQAGDAFAIVIDQPWNARKREKLTHRTDVLVCGTDVAALKIYSYAHTRERPA